MAIRRRVNRDAPFDGTEYVRKNGEWVTNTGGGGGLTNPVDYIDFDTTYVDGQQEGRLQWNSDDGTLEYGLPGGSVNLQVGQEQVYRVRNNTGATIPNGSVVYVSGSHASDRLEISLARADSVTTALAVGMATEDISTSGFGYITTFGTVRDVNTLGFTEGLPIFLSETVAGGYQQNRPLTGSGYVVALGYVIKADATLGEIGFSPVIVPRMDRLSGNKYEDPSDGDFYKYVAANSQFELHPLTVSDISDIDTTYLQLDGSNDPITGALEVEGALVASGGVASILPTGPTAPAAIEVGTGRSGNGASYIDFVGDTTYTDYALRLMRTSAGANANSTLTHRGTAQLQFVTPEDAPVIFIGGSSANRLYLTKDELRSYAPLLIEEQAAATLDVAGFGQHWVKNDTPNVPMFTDDAGNDYQLPYYETGTFTPTLLDNSLSASEGQTYTTQKGVYWRIGDIVNVWLQVTMSSLGTLTTTQQARIGGLPYTSSSSTDGGAMLLNAVNYSSLALPATGTIPTARVPLNQTYALMERQGGSTAQSQSLLISHITASGTIVLQGFYRI